MHMNGECCCIRKRKTGACSRFCACDISCLRMRLSAQQSKGWCDTPITRISRWNSWKEKRYERAIVRATQRIEASSCKGSLFSMSFLFLSHEKTAVKGCFISVSADLQICFSEIFCTDRLGNIISLSIVTG